MAKKKNRGSIFRTYSGRCPRPRITTRRTTTPQLECTVTDTSGWQRGAQRLAAACTVGSYTHCLADSTDNGGGRSGVAGGETAAPSNHRGTAAAPTCTTPPPLLVPSTEHQRNAGAGTGHCRHLADTNAPRHTTPQGGQNAPPNGYHHATPLVTPLCAHVPAAASPLPRA